MATPNYIDEDLATSLIQQESNFNPIARSKSGAMGLTQLMPDTADELGVKDPYDPEQSIEGGLTYLNQKIAANNGDLQLGLAAYNTGQGNLNKAIKKAGSRDWDEVKKYLPDPEQTVPYVDTILNNYNKKKSARLTDKVNQDQQAIDNPDSVDWGGTKEFNQAAIDVMTSPGFEDLSTPNKVGKIKELYNSKQWVPETDTSVRKVTEELWKGAAPGEKPDVASVAAPYLAKITGEDDKSILASGIQQQKEFNQMLKSQGVNPNFFGDDVHNAFTDKTWEETQNSEVRNRNIAGSALAYGQRASKDLVSTITAPITGVASLINSPETAKAIKEAPEDFYGSARELDYQVNPDGSVKKDDAGQPLKSYKGFVTGVVGQTVGLIAGGAAIKATAGAVAAATTLGGINAFTQMGSTYDNATSEGADRESALGAAALSLPGAFAETFAEMALTSSGAHWAKGLTGWNKYREVGKGALAAAVKGAGGMAAMDANQQLAVDAATGKSNFDTSRLEAAAAGGAIAGGLAGTYTTSETVDPSLVGKSRMEAEIAARKADQAARDKITQEGRDQLKDNLIQRVKQKAIAVPSTDTPVTEGDVATPEEQTALGRKFEKFQNDISNRLVLNYPDTKAIPEDLLNSMGFTATRVANDLIHVEKTTTHVPAETDLTNPVEVQDRVDTLSKDIINSPTRDEALSLNQRMAELKSQEADILSSQKNPSVDQTNSLVDAQKEVAQKILANRLEIRKTNNAVSAAVLNSEHDDLQVQAKQIQESIDKTPGGRKLAAVRSEINDIAFRFKELNRDTQPNDLMAKQNELTDLLKSKVVPDVEQKPGDFVEQDNYKKVALRLRDNAGNKTWALPFNGKWYILNDSGKLLTKGQSFLKDAINTHQNALNPKEPLKVIKIGSPIGAEKPSLNTSSNPETKGLYLDNGETKSLQSGQQDRSVPLDRLESKTTLGTKAGTTFTAESKERLFKTSKRPGYPTDKFVALQDKAVVPKGGISVVDAANQVKDILKTVDGNTTVSEGGIINKGLRGYNNFKVNYIKVARINDLPTTIHEVAHEIDKQTIGHWDSSGKGDFSDLPPEIQKGLINTANLLYSGDNIITSPDNLKIQEGFAMFLQHYMTNQPVHSDVLNWFDGDYAKEFPKQYEAIQKARQAALSFYQQTSEEYIHQQSNAKPPTGTQKFLASVGKEQLVNDWVDYSAPLKRADKVMGTNIGDLFDAKRNAAATQTNIALNDAVIDIHGNVVSEQSFKDSIAPAIRMKAEYELSNYMVAKRALVYNAYGKESGFAEADAKQVVYDTEHAPAGSKKEAAFISANNFWTNWNTFTNGLKNSSQGATNYYASVQKANLEVTGQAHGFYSPFVREGKETSTVPGKRVQGSTRRIEKPLDHIQDAIHAQYDGANKRFVLEALTNAADRRLPTSGPFVREVTDQVSITALNEDFNRKIEAANGSPEDPDTRQATSFLDPQSSTVQASDGYKFVTMVDKDGNNKYYEIAKNLHEVFQHTVPDYANSGWFKALFRVPKRILQEMSTTFNPAFQIANTARDAVTLVARTSENNPAKILTAVVQGLSDVVANTSGIHKFNEYSKLAERLALNTSTRYGSENALAPSGYKLWSPVNSSYAKFKEFLSVGEKTFRTANLILKANELGLKPNDILTPQQAVELALAYKRGTTDFSVQGNKAQVANMIVPFFTARIAEAVQGTQAAKYNPVKTAGLLAGAVGLGYAHALAHKDDDWYKEMGAEELSRNVHIPLDVDGQKRLLRIGLDSLSQIGFAIGSGAALGMHHNNEVDPGWYAFAKAAMGSTLPTQFPDSLGRFVTSISGPLAQEFVEQQANKDYFTNRNIVVGSLQQAPNAAQFTEHTSNTIKHLADLTGTSPLRMEHVLTSLAPAADKFLHTMERATGNASTSETRVQATNIVLEQMLKNGTIDEMSSKSMQNFYNNFDQYTKNKDVETPEQGKVRKQLDKMHTKLSAMSTVLSVMEDPDTRAEILNNKRILLQNASELVAGTPPDQLTPITKGIDLTMEAKKIKRERKEAAKLKAAAETTP